MLLKIEIFTHINLFKNMSEGLIIPIAWPDTTARGDERWYKMLKSAGIVKNLNFKVGHAAVILVNLNSGCLYYYDFGRYITPRGYGRTRSAVSDPKLKINSKAIIQGGRITNMEAICHELKLNSEATHGKGPMYFSISDIIHFDAAKNLADQYVERGSMLYGAIASGNSSCSRFVWHVFKEAFEFSKQSKLNILHETIMPSPISNVVNIAADNHVYRYDQLLERLEMNRKASLQFFIRQITSNFMKDQAALLPCDTVQIPVSSFPGCHQDQMRYSLLHGLGESAWYGMKYDQDDAILYLTRFDSLGRQEYQQHFYDIPLFFDTSNWNFDQCKVTYDSHYLHATFNCNNNVKRIEPGFKKAFIIPQSPNFNSIINNQII
jgi:hypothetical protein